MKQSESSNIVFSEDEWGKKIRRLYYGLEFEYYVAAKLWGYGFEAMKLPIDFGFDLIVYNQQQQSIEKRSPLNKPYVLQIKSCKISENYIKEDDVPGTGKCEVYQAVFYFNKSEIERILEEPSAFVIFIFALNTNPTEVVEIVWFNSKQFRKLFERKGGAHFKYDTQKKKYKLLMTVVGEINKKDQFEAFFQKVNDLFEQEASKDELKKDIGQAAKRLTNSLDKLEIKYTKKGWVRINYPTSKECQETMRYCLLKKPNKESSELADQTNLSFLSTDAEIAFSDD